VNRSRQWLHNSWGECVLLEHVGAKHLDVGDVVQLEHAVQLAVAGGER
jgi:hypothetical protein